MVATQNPAEHHGTNPLPESQLDRFRMRLRLGYPEPADEAALLRDDPALHALPELEPVLGVDDVLAMRAAAERVKLDDAVIALPARDRRARRAQHDAVHVGVSPRGALALRRAAQARALVDGRDFCIPEDVRELAVDVLAHRIVVDPRGAWPSAAARRASGWCARSSSRSRSRSERGAATRPRRRDAPRRGAPAARRRSRLRRWLRPPRTLQPTRAGWLFFALTLGVGFAALNTGNNLLYLVFSFLLGFLVLSGRALRGRAAAASRCAGACRASCSPRRRRRVALEVENAPAPGALLRDRRRGSRRRRAARRGAPRPRVRAAPRAGRAAAARLPAQRARARPAALRGLPRLDALPLRPVRASRCCIEAPGETLVYPALDARPRRAASAARAAASASRAAARTGAAPRRRACADFRPGDSARSVHWRASARRGLLLVRDREREEKPEFDVLLRTRGRPADDAFEAAVRRAASELVAHLRCGLPRGPRHRLGALPARRGPRPPGAAAGLPRAGRAGSGPRRSRAGRARSGP